PCRRNADPDRYQEGRNAMKELMTVAWSLVHRRKRSPFFAYVFHGGGANTPTGIGIDPYVGVGFAHSSLLVDPASAAAMNRRLAARLRADPRWCLKTMSRGRALASREQRCWRTLGRFDSAKLDAAQLANRYENYVASLMKLGAFVDWPPHFGV